MLTIGKPHPGPLPEPRGCGLTGISPPLVQAAGDLPVTERHSLPVESPLFAQDPGSPHARSPAGPPQWQLPECWAGTQASGQTAGPPGRGSPQAAQLSWALPDFCVWAMGTVITSLPCGVGDPLRVPPEGAGDRASLPQRRPASQRTRLRQTFNYHRCRPAEKPLTFIQTALNYSDRSAQNSHL